MVYSIITDSQWILLGDLLFLFSQEQGPSAEGKGT